MSLSALPPAPASQEKARAWIAARREEIHGDNAQRAAMVEGMMESIGSMLGNLGVSSLRVGQTHVDLGEPAPSLSSVEVRWAQSLAEGKFVGVLQAGNMLVSYHNDERVDMKKRRVDELVDTALIRALAPDAVVYGPGEVSPWPNLISNHGCSLWVDDRGQFEQLWAHVKQWMKTDWHDQVMAKTQYRHLAQDVFYLMAHYDLAQDLPWRIARHARAELLAGKSRELGQWNAAGQQELKKAIASLIQLEGHPLLAPHIAQTIEQLTPLLALAMDGKERQRRLDNEANKTRDHEETRMFRPIVSRLRRKAPQGKLHA